MSADRERGVTRAFVALSNSLVDGFDLVDLLSGLTADCAELLDIESAGLLLADSAGVLHVLAASSERTRSLELFQLQRAEVRVWTASAAAGRSSFRTSARSTVAGRSSRRERSRRVSSPCTRCP